MAEAIDKMTFEQALERLLKVVTALESGDTGLDQSLALYEEGDQLLKHCRAVLDQAEQKIRLLTGVDVEGNPITQPLPPTAAAENDSVGDRELGVKAKRTTGRAARRPAGDRAEEEEHLF